MKGGILPPMRRLVSYMGHFRWRVACIIALGLATSVLSAVAPSLLGEFTDGLSVTLESGGPIDLDALLVTALSLVVVFAVAMVTQAAGMRLTWVTEERLGDRLRVDMSRKISRMPVGLMDSTDTGDSLSRLVNDTDTLRMRSVESVTDVVEAVVTLIACAVAMVLLEPVLAAVAFIGPATGLVVIYAITRTTQRFYRAQSRDLGSINGIIEETYRSLDVVDSFNALPKVRERFAEVNGRLFSSAIRARFAEGLLPEAMSFVSNLTYVLVCVVGSILILDGTSSLGTLVAFIVYVKMVSTPMEHITRSVGAVQEVAASSERVFEFLDREEIPPEDPETDLWEVKGDVSFSSVRFSYRPGDEVLHGLDLQVSAGQKVAIVGPTGSGKTTIANLLLRFYDPDSGTISVDGCDLRSLARSDVRRMFAVVPQDSWLFRGSLRDNLLLGNGDVSDDRIAEVCGSMGLGEFVDLSEEGIGSTIDPDSLSAGQRQLLSIARAALRDAPMLVLDEATSSVDAYTESVIQAALDRISEGRTSFVIAHRLSTIVNADRIVVMRDGRVVESGTHGELMEAGGFYRQLYDSQFEGCD
ncbi:MAG: ABC transporter ATP-binding protein [Candidatus Methanomethylophilaceae archaeon]|nr:ABC transporter ATP-binding protein [Candidatus Methanomethylophilaceae archaeon]